MTDNLARLLSRSPHLRRIVWRTGRRLYCSARGEERVGNIAVNGESEVQRRVLAAVPATTRLRVLDIGANQGEWTLSLLRQISDARRAADSVQIDLFEPIPATQERLRAAIAAAGASDLTHVHGLALSDEPGEAEMAVMSATGGTNTIHFDASTPPPGGVVRVRKSTLAGFCREHGIAHIQLAKCDTEGHDSKVLKGALPLLQSGMIDVMQFEYNYRWIYSRSYLKDIFGLVRELPYRLARVQPGDIEVFDSWHPELERFFQSNYVLVHERALEWFARSEGRFDASNTFG